MPDWSIGNHKNPVVQFPLSTIQKSLLHTRDTFIESEGAENASWRRDTFSPPHVCRPGLLQIGLQDREYCYDKPSMLNILGRLVLKGSGAHSFSPGTILYVGEDATLEIDEGFTASHDLKIYCRHKITIGKDNMWSYYNVVMDNDGHHIFNQEGSHINKNQPVVFGNHVWMGCRCIVLKGSKIANGSMIASGTTVRKVFSEENCIYADGSEPLRSNIRWDRNLV